jgi:DNA polymerase-3 subunit alpha (Gram-positive type)
VRITSFDFETTGLTAEDNDIIEVGIVHFDDGKTSDAKRYSWLVKTDLELDPKVVSITGITPRQLKDEGHRWRHIAPKMVEQLESSDYWCIQNSDFDLSFMREALGRLDIEIKEKPIIDTLRVAQRFIPNSVLQSKALGKLSAFYGVPLARAHRAVEDAEATGHVLFSMLNQFDLKPDELTEPAVLFLGEYHLGEDPFEALYSGLPRKIPERY